MKFSEVAGHESVKTALKGMADSGRMAHAILLCGAPGIGKMDIARAYSQYVHCGHRKGGDSCGTCPSCVQHQGLNNPDMHYVYPVIKRDSKKASLSTDFIDEWREALNGTGHLSAESWLEAMDAQNKMAQISVDEASDIISGASLSPYKEDYKIYLIWLPEKLHPSAANKLLKIIEEPYPDTLFILVSDNPGGILPTIRSRTQVFNMKPLSQHEINNWLVDVKGVNEYDAYETARLSEGSVGTAEMLAAASGERREFGEMFRDIMRKAYVRDISGLKRDTDLCAAMGREKLHRFLDYTLKMVRENFIYNMREPCLNLMTNEEEEFSRRFSPYVHSGNIEAISRETERASTEILRNANSKIVMFSYGLLLSRYIRTGKG